MACALRGVEDLVVEDRELEGKTQTDGVGGREVNKGNVLRCFIGQQRLLCRFLAFSAGLKLCQIAVVVALHLEVEDLGFSAGGSGNKVLIKEGQDAAANVLQLFLDLRGGEGGGGAMGGDERGGMVMVARERIDVKTLRERGES